MGGGCQGETSENPGVDQSSAKGPGPLREAYESQMSPPLVGEGARHIEDHSSDCAYRVC